MNYYENFFDATINIYNIGFNLYTTFFFQFIYIGFYLFVILIALIPIFKKYNKQDFLFQETLDFKQLILKKMN
jgi:hypothetical protein